MNVSTFHCMPAPVIPIGCILKMVSLAINAYLCVSSGEGEGEQDPSDY